MKHLMRAAAVGLGLLAAGVSPAIAGETRPTDLALLVEAQSRLSAQIATASLQKNNSQYSLLGERRQVDGMIAALKAGENVAPERIERALKRARVLQ